MDQLKPEQLQALMGAAETKKLLALLQRDGGDAWKRATQAVRQGDYAKTQSILQPMVSGTEAAAIAQALRQKLG